MHFQQYKGRTIHTLAHYPYVSEMLTKSLLVLGSKLLSAWGGWGGRDVEHQDKNMAKLYYMYTYDTVFCMVGGVASEVEVLMRSCSHVISLVLVWKVLLSP